MREELIVTGYCRGLGQSRIVEAEPAEGILKADCDWGHCAYEAVCPIARRLWELERETRKTS